MTYFPLKFYCTTVQPLKKNYCHTKITLIIFQFPPQLLKSLLSSQFYSCLFLFFIFSVKFNFSNLFFVYFFLIYNLRAKPRRVGGGGGELPPGPPKKKGWLLNFSKEKVFIWFDNISISKSCISFYFFWQKKLHL